MERERERERERDTSFARQEDILAEIYQLLALREVLVDAILGNRSLEQRGELNVLGVRSLQVSLLAWFRVG